MRVVLSLFLTSLIFVSTLLVHSVEMTWQAQAEVEHLKRVIIEKEQAISSAEYRRSELAKKYNAKFTALEKELAETHDLYQSNIIEIDKIEGDEMSRREGMIKVIYAGCLLGTPDPFYCGKRAATAYQKKIWNEVDNNIVNWDKLWALIRGTKKS